MKVSFSTRYCNPFKFAALLLENGFPKGDLDKIQLVRGVTYEIALPENPKLFKKIIEDGRVMKINKCTKKEFEALNWKEMYMGDLITHFWPHRKIWWPALKNEFYEHISKEINFRETAKLIQKMGGFNEWANKEIIWKIIDEQSKYQLKVYLITSLIEYKSKYFDIWWDADKMIFFNSMPNSYITRYLPSVQRDSCENLLKQHCMEHKEKWAKAVAWHNLLPSEKK